MGNRKHEAPLCARNVRPVVEDTGADVPAGTRPFTEREAFMLGVIATQRDELRRRALQAAIAQVRRTARPMAVAERITRDPATGRVTVERDWRAVAMHELFNLLVARARRDTDS